MLQQIIVTKEQKQKRNEICDGCDKKIVFMQVAACGVCNCPLSGKTTLTHSKCPLGKWGQGSDIV